jgi:hypothetical protein
MNREMDFSRNQSALDLSREQSFSARRQAGRDWSILVTRSTDDPGLDLQTGPAFLQRFRRQSCLRQGEFAATRAQDNLIGHCNNVTAGMGS